MDEAEEFAAYLPSLEIEDVQQAADASRLVRSFNARETANAFVIKFALANGSTETVILTATQAGTLRSRIEVAIQTVWAPRQTPGGKPN